MTLRIAHNFRHTNFVAAIVVAALIAAACGGDDAPAVVDAPSDLTATTTVGESSTPVQEDHPCEAGEGQIEGRYCLVDGQWYANAGAGHWVESDGPPATTTTVVPDETVGSGVEEIEPELTLEPELTPEPEPVPLAECSEGEHRHTPEGACHYDADILTNPPSACNDDPSDGVCFVDDAEYRLTEQNVWLHEHLPEPIVMVTPEIVDEPVVTVPVVDEPVVTVPVVEDATCSDVASRDGAVSGASSTEFRFELTEGVWRYELCVVGDPYDSTAGVQVYMNFNDHDEPLPAIEHFEGSQRYPGYVYADRSGDQDGLRWVAEVTVVAAEDYDQDSRAEYDVPRNADGTLGAYPAGFYYVNLGLWGHEGYVFHLSRIGDGEAAS